MASSRQAGIIRTIIDVSTDVMIVNRLHLEATVALALIVINVSTCWIRMVDAPTVRSAAVPSTVINVQATGMSLKSPISLACGDS
jgi:hypothetical protein